MILKKRVIFFLSALLFLSGCAFNQTEENIVLQIAASDSVKKEVKNNNQSQYQQVYETKEEEIAGTRINKVVYKEAEGNNGISWLAAKIQDAQNARQEVELIHTVDQFGEKISTITVPGSKKLTPAQPTIYQYGAQLQVGAVYSPGFTTRYGYDCGGCSVTADDFSGTASGIKLGADRVRQANGQWKDGYTYEGYHIVATSSAIPLFSILKISNHPFSGGGITAGQPFYAIVGDRGVSGSSIDLFAGSEKNLNVISQSRSPRNSNMRVEIVRIGK